MSRKQELILTLIFCLVGLMAGRGLVATFTVAPVADNGANATRSLPGSGRLGEQVAFNLLDDSDQQRSLQELQAGKPTFLFLFTGSCTHCINTLQDMKSILPKIEQKGFRVIGVNYNSQPAQNRVIKENSGLTAPIFADPYRAVSGRLHVDEFTLLLLDGNSRVYYRNVMLPVVWPNETVLDFVLTSNSQPTKIGPIDSSQRSTNNVKNDSPSFDGRIFKKPGNWQIPMIILLGITILIISTILLRRRTGSGLPIMAAASLLMVGAIAGALNYFPANLFLVIAAVTLVSPGRQRLWFALLALICCYICLLLSISLNLKAEPVYQVEQVGWQLLPQAILSLLMFAMVNFDVVEKRIMENILRIESSRLRSDYPGSLAIKGVSQAERCDVCHQSDQFDLATGFCTRCQVKTN